MTAARIPNATYPVPIKGSKMTLTEGIKRTNTATNTVITVAMIEIHMSPSLLISGSAKESSYIPEDTCGAEVGGLGASGLLPESSARAALASAS